MSTISVNKLAREIANMIKKEYNVFQFYYSRRPIEIKHARWNANILLLLKSDIEDKINKIKSGDRSKTGCRNR